jgi:hypothetical protein
MLLSRSKSYVNRIGTILGAWRSMPTPNARTLERAAKYRGGQDATTFGHKFTLLVNNETEDAGRAPKPTNLKDPRIYRP